MRVLLIDENAAEARLMLRELAGRYEVRHVDGYGPALEALSRRVWRPEAVVAALESADPDTLDALASLQAAAVGVPVLVRVGGSVETLRRQLEALAGVQASDHGASFSLLKAVLAQQHLVHQTVSAHRDGIGEDIGRLGRQAADAAVGQILGRLGLDDEEGLRLAIRLARGWEAAKLRFFQAVATGIGTAFLLALGAGVAAMLRQQELR